MSGGRGGARTAVLGLCLAAALATAPAGARAQSADGVRAALREGRYDRTIALALEALRADPGDDEVRFLLARAYAYSGKWDEGEAVADALLAAHPADSDLIVFKGRLRSWRGDLEGAERAFRRALEAEPRSADALAGLADLAAWRGDLDGALVLCRRALDLDVAHAGALHRVGTVLLWRGDYGRARGYLARAVELEPADADFRLSLGRAVPLFVRRPEIRLTGRTEHWSDGRPDGRDLGLEVLFGLFGDRARFVAKAGRFWRAGGRDDGAGLEVYPRLWKGAYGYFDLSVAPGADAVPRSAVHAEVYQSFLTRFEASLGVRRIAAPDGAVLVTVASAAAYLGPWYPNVRMYAAEAGTGFTWMAGLRRYFAGASSVWATVGRGARPPETGVVEEVLAGPAWFAEAGFDVFVLRDVKLRGYVSRRAAAAGPGSTAFSLAAGYRF